MMKKEVQYFRGNYKSTPFTLTTDQLARCLIINEFFNHLNQEKVKLQPEENTQELGTLWLHWSSTCSSL